MNNQNYLDLLSNGDHYRHLQADKYYVTQKIVYSNLFIKLCKRMST